VTADEVAVEVTDKVQVSAMLSPERAVGGSLKKGDLVGVYLSFDPFEYDDAGQESETVDAIRALEPAESSAATSTATVEEEDDKETPNLTRLEFQHVLVTNVQTTSDPVVPDQSDEGDADDLVEQVTGSQYIVTLALSPEQSERFVFATEFGHVWLSNQPATVSDDGTRLVTLGNVYSVVL
jgi:pilus assembly protein CpaB